MIKITLYTLLICSAYLSHTYGEEPLNITDLQQPIHLTIVLNNNGSSQTTNSTEQLPTQKSDQQIDADLKSRQISDNNCTTLNMTKTQYTVIAMVKGVAVSSLPYLCPPLAVAYWTNRILIYPFFVDDPLFAQEKQDPNSGVRVVDTLVAFPVAYHTKKHIRQIISNFWWKEESKDLINKEADSKKG